MIKKTTEKCHFLSKPYISIFLKKNRVDFKLLIRFGIYYQLIQKKKPKKYCCYKSYENESYPNSKNPVLTLRKQLLSPDLASFRPMRCRHLEHNCVTLDFDCFLGLSFCHFICKFCFSSLNLDFFLYFVGFMMILF